MPTTIGAVTILAWLSGTPVAARADDLPAAMVVAVGDVDPSSILEGARRAGGAQWTSTTLEPIALPPAEPPEAAITRMQEEFATLQFGACISLARSPELDVVSLLAARFREQAATVAALSAMCAYQQGDEELARYDVTRAVATELDIGRHLSEAAPELRALANTIEEAHQDRVELALTSRPSGARFFVDGRAVSCRGQQCAIPLRRGTHVVVAERLGFLTRVGTVEVTEPMARTFALDPAPTDVLLTQLRVSASDTPPDDPRFARLASEAFGVPVVLLAWRDAGALRLVVFDRRKGERGRLVAHSRGQDSDAADASTAAVNEWRQLEPSSILVSPWFWLSAVVVAAGIVVGTYFLATQEPTYRVVVQ